MKRTLPPKRFEDPNDPRFDPIRHEKWFRQVLKRRAQLPQLQLACLMMHNSGCNQKAAAELAGVDARELRDYLKFWAIAPYPDSTPVEQDFIMTAYMHYCSSSASWYKCLDAVSRDAKLTRRVKEKWEVDPRFYPVGYIHQ